ncbi:Hypothetical protein Minf_0608 [Methylacidiphilum infernorum V4]|uniref:Uncharacterized protein n=1 Tax=Methylacidiphilum infernorum (isolate V4) TaxID=481448 RepID=B3E005_METI4|nr:Hypothetical protein Minf_0608 [Methylacidiphilum infernorum V4]
MYPTSCSFKSGVVGGPPWLKIFRGHIKSWSVLSLRTDMPNQQKEKRVDPRFKRGVQEAD